MQETASLTVNIPESGFILFKFNQVQSQILKRKKQHNGISSSKFKRFFVNYWASMWSQVKVFSTENWFFLFNELDSYEEKMALEPHWKSLTTNSDEKTMVYIFQLKIIKAEI